MDDKLSKFNERLSMAKIKMGIIILIIVAILIMIKITKTDKYYF